MRLEAALVGPARLPLPRLLKQHLGLVRGEPRRVRLKHRVIGGRGPHALEKRAAILERVHELGVVHERRAVLAAERLELGGPAGRRDLEHGIGAEADRKSTRLNSSHSQISYAVFCLKKKKKTNCHVRTVSDSLMCKYLYESYHRSPTSTIPAQSSHICMFYPNA